MVPDSVAPEAGEVMETVNGMVFPPLLLLPPELLTLAQPAPNSAKPKTATSKGAGGVLIPISFMVRKPRISLNPLINGADNRRP